MKRKFKKGDRVRLTAAALWQFPYLDGKEATVTGLTICAAYVRVRIDGARNVETWNSNHWEFVTEATECPPVTDGGT